ncbi:MAG: 4-(cytidine 5'-diphospho)-2-C-methyl-D-erythritol kinase [Ferruginibacter sp.]
MIAFPNCKINIGLQIIGKRADGYHDLQTIFYPVVLKDALEIIDNTETNDAAFSTTGITIDGNAENNLCLKAYQLLKKDFPQLPGIKMHLHKTIPLGAGLGGGSADAAFTLQLLNKKYALGLDPESLNKYAADLGSDCPFFLMNKPCFASGRGEILEEVTLDLSAWKILLINPGIHINTGWAFSALEKMSIGSNLKEHVSQPVATWREHISNDFEIPVFKAHKEIASIKENLYKTGAIYAAMSGSGSSLYGIFEKDAVPKLNFPSHYFQKWV